VKPTSLGVLALAIVGACGGTDLPPLTNATQLHCPTPGDLPFRLGSSGYKTASNTGLVKNDPRNKDEASDTIGNPNGKIANIYLADSASASAMTLSYRGAKARTTTPNGLFSNPLAGETVSLWTYDAGAWSQLGSTQTGDDGTYELPDTGFIATNGQPVYAMLEADGSCAAHYDYLFPVGEKVVVSDIDATLTTNDGEFDKQLADVTYQPTMMGAADKLTQAWSAKGYPIIYLTARPHTVRVETRGWLDDLGFPPGPLLTAIQVEEASAYKTAWLKRMVTDFGWNIVAAYGNATTDITAYANVAIPLNHTFIVGPEGGKGGTTAIPNMDFTAHIASYVAAQPANN
jgi:LNS2 (Lipin/Ned1/Smp2)